MQDASPESAHSRRAQKVLIPRLQHNEPPPPPRKQSDEKQKAERVGRACTNCRKRKIRCSGEVPCVNCVSQDLECVYQQARRDRLKSATQRNQALVDLLKDLSLRVDNDDKRRIEDALDGVGEDLPPAPASVRSVGKRRKASTPEGEEDVPGEANAPASVGSNEDLDILDEDLLRTRESRETGYVGSVSEIQWLRSLQREIATPGSEPYEQPYGPAGAGNAAIAQRSEALHVRQKSRKPGTVRPLHETTFYLDNDSIELEVMVDPHEVPPPDVAQRLFDCYLKTVHRSFPIVPNGFEDQFRKYYDAVRQGRPFQVPEKWLAIMNLIFAIGAQYSHLTNADWRGDDRDHVVYMTRALRLIGLKDVMMVISAPDLSLIQTTGLLAFYYLVIGHVSRAWILIGIAIRHALSLGLHLRNEDLSTPPAKKAIMVRTWWSLHAIECLLSSVTGRPCVLENDDCTVSLPQDHSDEPFVPESPTITGGRTRKRSVFSSPTERSESSGDSDPSRRAAAPRSYLDAHLRVGLITQKVLSSLYAPRAATRSWNHVQRTIPDLLRELDNWKMQVLPEEGGTPINPFPSDDAPRELKLLQFYYYSTRILITRPCLCRIERRIRGQSEGSSTFNQQTALSCVGAAQALTQLLPHQPDLDEIYANGPWWSLLHYIMQAMAVLLLEISYGRTHMLPEEAKLFPYVKKLIGWLRVMTLKDPVSERAYNVVVRILRSSGPYFQSSVNDLLADDESEHAASKMSPQGFFGLETRPNFGLQAPMGEDWYSGYFAGNQGNLVDENSGSFDPQLFADLDQTQTRQTPNSMQSQNEPSYHTDQYPFFLGDPMANPSAYSNPFVTTFDQDVQIPVTMDDLRTLWSTSLADGPVQEQERSGSQETE